MKIEYKEKQKFTQWWIWLFLVGSTILLIFGIYKQIILGEEIGNNPMPDLGLILVSVLMIGLIAIFWLMKLETEIDENEIRMNFPPFVKKRVSWKEIKKAEVVNYGFIGGWGIRLWTKYGNVYNTKGNKGLAIELLNGKQFLIGTQNESELKKTVQFIQSKSHYH